MALNLCFGKDEGPEFRMQERFVSASIREIDRLPNPTKLLLDVRGGAANVGRATVGFKPVELAYGVTVELKQYPLPNLHNPEREVYLACDAPGWDINGRLYHQPQKFFHTRGEGVTITGENKSLFVDVLNVGPSDVALRIDYDNSSPRNIHLSEARRFARLSYWLSLSYNLKASKEDVAAIMYRCDPEWFTIIPRKTS